jgi:hypothetical protein
MSRSGCCYRLQNEDAAHLLQRNNLGTLWQTRNELAWSHAPVLLTGTTDEPKKAHLNKIYLDHISENGNKQDKASVFSMVEAIVIDTVTKYPHIKEITLVLSDNASIYQNTMILLVLPVISYAYGLLITR